MAFSIKKFAKKATQQFSNTFEKLDPTSKRFDWEKAALAALTGGASTTAEIGIETAGALSGQVSNALGNPFSKDSGDQVTAQIQDQQSVLAEKKKKQQEALLRNSPGIRQQSVLTPRV